MHAPAHKPADPFDRHLTWAEHKATGKTVNIEIGQTVVDGRIRWYGTLVLSGERISLPGGAVPAGARLAHKAIQQAARRQLQLVDAQRIERGLQRRPQEATGQLFGDQEN